MISLKSSFFADLVKFIVYIYVYNFFEIFFCFLAASNLLFYIDKNGEKCKSLIQSSKIQMV